MRDMYLNEDQVRDFIKEAEAADEVIVIRCVRKTKASKPGGPDVGDLYDLHCVKKPPYKAVGTRDRAAEDKDNGVLTVYVSNRRGENGEFGAWRRVNIAQVKKVIYQGNEYEVVAS